MKNFKLSGLLIVAIGLISCNKDNNLLEQLKAVIESDNPVANMPNEILSKPLEIFKQPKKIAMQSLATIRVKDNGTLWTWGTGTLLDGRTQSLVPVKVEDINDVVGVSSGISSHVLILKRDGTVWGWGDNRNGQIDPLDKDVSIDKLTKINGINDIVNIVANYHNSFFLNKSGEILVTGEDWTDKNWDKETNLMKPTTLYGIDNLKQLNIVTIKEGYPLFAISKDGKLYEISYPAYHTNTQKQKGSQLISSSFPIKNPTGKYKIQQINFDKKVVDAIGGGTKFVLLEDGTVWNWGSSHDSAVGAKGLNDIAEPTRVKGLSKVTHLSKTAVNTEDGSIYFWGRFGYSCNTCFPNGIGSLEYREPHLLTKNFYAKELVSGNGVNSAIDMEDNIWSWGTNEYGQKGVYEDRSNSKKYITKKEDLLKIVKAEFR